ncbi:unnamed protein product [Arctia plantaginis]|uniref:Uncharacterized protein n=1 Tax=Arctia plantaginis TaxID=874455 RepID=A0A8S0ZFL6_ARCPL|nr:unnamed protein product [Arctia plantaginis]CAB3229922.1 unnamed protein product [Arctia plantaginis]
MVRTSKVSLWGANANHVRCARRARVEWSFIGGAERSVEPRACRAGCRAARTAPLPRCNKTLCVSANIVCTICM